MYFYMITRLKRLLKLRGKKRYIVLGFLAFELLSLPAAAGILTQVSFGPSPYVAAAEIPTSEPGVSRFLVTSNDGFDIKAYGVTGEVKVEVVVSGTIAGGSDFGSAAQLPGPQSECVDASGDVSDVYAANRETAAAEGTTPERAVVFKLEYDVDANPRFEFVSDNNSDAALTSCSIAES